MTCTQQGDVGETNTAAAGAATTARPQQPPASAGQAAPAMLASVVGAYLKSPAGVPAPEFRHALVDLNGDNQDDALVLLLGMDYCGTGGCTVLVLRGSGTGFEVISRMTVTSEPIRVTSEVRNGWKSLIVHTRGAESLMVFNGKSYPSNPSVQPKATAEQLAAAVIVIK